MAADFRIVKQVFCQVVYIIKKPQQLYMPVFQLINLWILSGWKILPRQFTAGDFNIVFHVVMLILLKGAFGPYY